MREMLRFVTICFCHPAPILATDSRNADRNTAIRVAWSEDVVVTGNQAIDLGITPGYDERFLDATENVTGLVESGTVNVSAEGLAKSISWSETTGNVAEDRSQQSQPAVLDSANPNTDGWLGNGVAFDGLDDFADSFDGSSATERVNRTVATWVRLDNVNDATGKQVIYDEGDSDTGLNIYVFDGRLYFRTGTRNRILRLG